ncbi:hypothetical protein BD770DRAFT_411778 [Pilaira anomala]|nr:hypothetical protein BD770DRAFT_411778 [Pilaira anomala]
MYRQTESTKTDMDVEFNEEFCIGKKFASVEQMKANVKTFGEKHDIVFSISKSTPSKGQYVYICKHGVYKRDKIDDKSIEKKYKKKSTQKFGCPAYIKVYNLITLNAMGINNVIKKDIQNIQALFPKDDNRKEMYSLIKNLEDLNYIVRIQVKATVENISCGKKVVKKTVVYVYPFEYTIQAIIYACKDLFIYPLSTIFTIVDSPHGPPLVTIAVVT